jgi:hypothetical protein
VRAEHLEILVEEPSMEAFLKELLPRLIGDRATFSIHVHQGKPDLLAKLEPRLRGYARWLPETHRIVVIVDRDDTDCQKLKQGMEQAAANAGLRTRSVGGSAPWRVVNRIAIEELEAWYFGEWNAVRRVYGKVPEAIPRQAAYRFPDAIEGGTWEALERILQRAGYFSAGLPKVECARGVGMNIDPVASTSPSFIVFRDAVIEAVS